MSFSVQIEPGGFQFSVAPGESVLEAALRQGLNLPYGCRNGSCGSCLARLISGEVTYPGGMPELLGGHEPGTCLLCRAVPLADLRCQLPETAAEEPPPPRILPCRVERREPLAHDVIRLYLKLPEGQSLNFLAGQYLDILLPDGRRRAFSIANAPHDADLIELHIRHVAGGEFTDYVFSHLHPKEILRIQAPLGRFVSRGSSTRPRLFMAGGTGFAPIKGMLEHAFHTRVQQPLYLYWGVRGRRDLYLSDLPRRWAEEHENFRYVPVLSEPDPDWDGRRGFVHQAILEDFPDPSGFDLYMAGPPVMVQAGRAAFAAAGLGLEHMFADAFEYAADSPGKGAG